MEKFQTGDSVRQKYCYAQDEDGLYWQVDVNRLKFLSKYQPFLLIPESSVSREEENAKYREGILLAIEDAQSGEENSDTRALRACITPLWELKIESKGAGCWKATYADGTGKRKPIKMYQILDGHSLPEDSPPQPYLTWKKGLLLSLAWFCAVVPCLFYDFGVSLGDFVSLF